MISRQTEQHSVTVTSSSAVAARPRDASCLSVVSFNSTVTESQLSISAD